MVWFSLFYMNLKIKFLIILISLVSLNSLLVRNSFSTKLFQKKVEVFNRFKIKHIRNHKNPWISIVSTNSGAFEAVDEVISNLSDLLQAENKKTYILLFFISSIYEMTAFNYDYIFEKLDLINNGLIQDIIGCTTGTAIGTSKFELAPIEAESRPAFSALLVPIEDFKVNSFHLTEEMLEEYKRSNRTFEQINSKDSINLLFATNNIKDYVTNILTNVNSKDNIKVFGAFASSVTSLQAPKLFHKSTGGSLNKITNGLIGLSISGDIDVHSVIAHSCIPVGPIYRILDCNDNEIISMENTQVIPESTKPSINSPLVHLCELLEILPEEQSFKLKEQLLISIVTSSPEDIQSKGYKTLFESTEYFTQQPIKFDQITGSITISHVPNLNSSFQFCVREPPLARKDMRRVLNDLKNIINSPTIGEPLSILMFGSNERGNKLFRYTGWESLQLSYLLNASKYENNAVISGLYTNGVFTNLNTLSDKTIPAIMESNSFFSVFTKKSTNNKVIKDIVIDNNIDLDIDTYNSEDIMTLDEITQFNDINDIVLVSKKDTDSSHAVRVATMDFTVPEKAPQPSNVLESLVWEREKEVDRLRERFQLNRALLQVKAATNNFKSIDFINIIKSFSLSNTSPIPGLIIEITKDSLYKGKLLINNQIPSTEVLISDLSTVSNIIGVSVNVDTAIYNGDYKDIELVKSKTKYPIICNDFVIYAYQIFQAKTSGADVIKFMASILSIQELNYLIKIAKAFNMLSIVVVSSKIQLLNVINNIQDIQVISVTGRNHRIWKIQPNKVKSILSDPEVITALSHKKSSDNNFVLLQEGFSSKQEIIDSKLLGIDAVIIGEELIDTEGDNYANKINYWIN